MSGRMVTTGRTGVFIDFSNLFWSVKRTDPETGDRTNFDICFEKLKQFLETRHKPLFYNVYACEDAKPTKEPYISKAAKHAKFLRFLEGTGYTVVRKDLKHLEDHTKCDTDVEITMGMHKHSSDIDNIILISGDSDFLSAVQHFRDSGKYIHIYAFDNCLAWELRMYAIQNPRCNFTLFDEIRDQVERIRT